MLASSTAWNSGVSGACWASPGGLLWSHWVPMPRGRFHCPFQSGYFDSSWACAPARARHKAAATAAPIAFQWDMTFPLAYPAYRARPGVLVPEQAPAFFVTGRIHRLQPEAEVFARIQRKYAGLAGTGVAVLITRSRISLTLNPGLPFKRRSALAARVARACAELVKPILQGKRLLLRWLDVVADRARLAARVGARPAAPREVAEIGRANTSMQRLRWRGRAFSGWPVSRGHPGGRRLSGRHLGGRYLSDACLRGWW